jgi:hypothetical protein
MIDVTLEATLLKSSIFPQSSVRNGRGPRSICLCTWWLADGAEPRRDTNHETWTKSTKKLLTAMADMAGGTMSADQPS